MGLYNFRATNIHKAFILNALATSLIAYVSVQVKAYVDILFETTLVNEFFKVTLSIIVGFIAAIAIYYILFYIFNFGGGMLAGDEPVTFWEGAGKPAKYVIYNNSRIVKPDM